ncbi:MAG: hypothetical protein QXF88_00700 [Candidatus Aenigmatarchaeota archaeon]
MTVETRIFTGFRVDQLNHEVDFSPSNPKNYGILDDKEVDALENKIPELKGEELKVATMRLFQSILYYTSELFPEAKEVVQNWGNFIIPYLYGVKAHVQLENEKSSKVILRGYPTTIYYSENRVVGDDGLCMTDFVVTGFDLKRIVTDYHEQKAKISPLVLSKRPADRKFLEWFASNLLLEIDFKYKQHSSSKQSQYTIQGLFAIYELLPLAKKIPQPALNSFIEQIIESLKPPSYESLMGFVKQYGRPTEPLASLCEMTWPITVKIIQQFYSDKLRLLNWKSQY